MKKLYFLCTFIALALLLVGCGQGNGSKTGSQSEEVEEEVSTLTVYKPDAESTFVEPYELEYTGNEDGLVTFIYDEVVTHEVGLIDFKFENNGESLVLNLDEGVKTVQGSAGGFLFAGTLVESYFANYPNLDEVTFIHNGSYEEILDHLSVGQPYTRENAAFTNEK